MMVLCVGVSCCTYRALGVVTGSRTCRLRTLMHPRGKILLVQGQIPSTVVLRSLSGRPCTGRGCPLRHRSQRRPPLAIAHDLDDALKLGVKGVFNSLESELMFSGTGRGHYCLTFSESPVHEISHCRLMCLMRSAFTRYTYLWHVAVLSK